MAGLRRLTEVLGDLKIPYFIVGSVAGAVHGIPRSTMDVDLVAGLLPRHVPEFASKLAGDFYTDAQMIADALRHGRAFNLIHFGSSYKFDVFPLSATEYSQAQFDRRANGTVSLDGAETLDVPVATAEDTVLNKLVWYRAGGGVSERQWNDIRGIIAVQGDRLDRDYIRQWAGPLGVADLLDPLGLAG